MRFIRSQAAVEERQKIRAILAENNPTLFWFGVYLNLKFSSAELRAIAEEIESGESVEKVAA